MMNQIVLALLVGAANAFNVGVATMRSTSPTMRTTAPQAMLAPDVATSLSTINLVAEADDTTTLLLASGGLISFIFLFMTVGACAQQPPWPHAQPSLTDV